MSKKINATLGLSKRKKIKLNLFFKAFWIVMLFTSISCLNDGTWNSGKKVAGLEVSKEGHSLLRDGKPFFWMGDTGWFLFTQSPGDVDFYFQNRAAHQFNAIQMMVTQREFNKPDFLPNYRGDLPFESMNPVKLNERYFAHIDTIAEKAEKYNMVLAMVPTWGLVLDQIFSVNDPGKAYDYGYLLGKRYKQHKNIVWVVCGEYHLIAWDTVKTEIYSPNLKEINLIENLARGLKDGNKGNNLMTIHPDSYKSSTDNFHDAEWLDFNMVQSFSIRKDTEFDIINDYRRMPYKPTFLGEPGYEYGFAGNRAFEIRYEGYHSVLNGGFGYTYGREGIWNFKENWKSFLDSEGALQMKYMRYLFESRPILHRTPAPEMINGCQGDWVKKTKIAAAREDSGAYAFIYFPGDTIKVEVNVGEGISGETANAWWYNPRDGKTYDADGGKTKEPFAQYPCGKSQKDVFDPPGDNGLGNDWILILDGKGKQ